MYKHIHVRSFEVGLLYRRGEFERLLAPGRHFMWDLWGRLSIDVLRAREPFVNRPDLGVLVKTGALDEVAETFQLAGDQRALVWLDNRFVSILGPGRHAVLNGYHDVRVEVVDATKVRFEHERLEQILDGPASRVYGLTPFLVPDGQVGLVRRNGEFSEELGPGRYAFWNGVGAVERSLVDLRETQLDVSGQELMTADRVTLRLNAVVTYKVVDARRSVSVVQDARMALYREAQLALRAVVGTRELDTLLGDKDIVAKELVEMLRERAGSYGLTLVALGIKDVILPGEMKTLLNQVMEARKAAEA